MDDAGDVNGVAERDRRSQRGPGAAFAGFLVSTALLTCVVVAFGTSWVHGWRGGEYACAFLGVTLGSLVLGAGLAFARPPWRSVGTGLLLGGLLGVLAAVAGVVLVLVALSRWGQSS